MLWSRRDASHAVVPFCIAACHGRVSTKARPRRPPAVVHPVVFSNLLRSATFCCRAMWRPPALRQWAGSMQTRCGRVCRPSGSRAAAQAAAAAAAAVAARGKCGGLWTRCCAIGGERGEGRLADCFAALLLSAAAGCEWRAAVRPQQPGGPLVADQQPTACSRSLPRHIGFIAMMLPDACIVHAVRHPADAGLSCFAQPFEGRGTPWASNLSRE